MHLHLFFYVCQINKYTVSQKNCATFIFTVTLANVGQFLADRTNGRAIATLLRLSVVVCRRL